MGETGANGFTKSTIDEAIKVERDLILRLIGHVAEVLYFPGNSAGMTGGHIVIYFHKADHILCQHEKGLDLGVESRVNVVCEEEQFKLLGDLGKDLVLQPSLLEYNRVRGWGFQDAGGRRVQQWHLGWPWSMGDRDREGG
jgi:hypothetical protein